MQAIIFSAGLGTRLRPITDSLPKALVPLNGVTLLEYQIRMLRNAGIRDIAVNVHHFPDLIIDFLRTHDNFGCSIRISDERDELLDTGGGLLHAFLQPDGSLPSEPVLACNVDILSNIDLPAFLTSLRSDELGRLVVSDRPTQRYLCFNEDNRLVGWKNIQTGELRLADGRHLAFSGMSLLQPEAFSLLKQYAADHGPRFSMIDFFLSVAPMHTLRAYVPADYRMMDVGKFNLLSEAEAFAQELVPGD